MSKTPIVALGDIAHFIRGINFKPDDVVPLGTEGSVACMRTKNVQSELDLTDVWAVDESFVRRDEQLLQAGDILVSSANSWNLVGKCSWIPELPWRASFGGFVSVLRANPAHVDARFLYQWFSWEHTQALLRSFGQKTTNISNLNIERALALKLPCHPQEEQRRIAAILDQAETLRTQRRTALALLDSLTQSLFLDMFGDPVANPKSFVPGVLGDVCDLFNGYAFKSDDYVETSNTLNCRMSNIRPNGEFDIEYHPKYLPDKYAEEYKRFLLRDGDVIIAMTDMASEVKILGVPTIVDTKGKAVLLNQRVGKLLLRDSVEIDIPFLRQMLSQKYVKIFYQKFASGGVQINLGKNDLLSVPIVLPPLALQQTFATRIASIEALKATHRRALVALDALFASLQQRAFAGQL